MEESTVAALRKLNPRIGRSLFGTHPIQVLLMVGLCSIVAGCVAAHIQVQEMAAQGNHSAAIAMGLKQIANAKPNDPELPLLRQRVAEAAFERATQDATAPAHRQFREMVKGWNEAAGLRTKSFQLESQIVYDTEVALSNRPEDHQSFRQNYPTSPRIRASRHAEISLAWKRAQHSNSEAAYRSFRQQYAAWPEAAKQTKETFIQEAKVAFEMAEKKDTLAAYQQFRADYPHAAQVNLAHQREANNAWAHAKESKNPDEIARVRAEYGALLSEEVVAETRRLEVAYVVEAIERFEATKRGEDALQWFLSGKNSAVRLRFLERYGTWPEAAAEVKTMRLELVRTDHSMALMSTSNQPLERYLALYGEWPEAAPYLESIKERLAEYKRADFEFEAQENAVKAAPKDAKVIAEIVRLLDEHRSKEYSEYSEYSEYGDGETRAQREEREKAFEKAKSKTIRAWRGKKVSFEFGMVTDVDPETALTRKGKARLKRAFGPLRRTKQGRELIRMFKDTGGGIMLALMAMPHLIGCKGCYRNTGKYQVKVDLLGHRLRDCDYESRRGWEVTFVVIYRSKKKALALSKGDVIPVKGALQSLNIEDGKLELFIR